jgi:hypothetical protein
MTRTCRLSWLALALAVSVVTPAAADSYLIYDEGGIPGNGTDIWTWCDAGQPCDVQEGQACDNPEGSHFLRANTNIWAGMGVFLNIDATNTPQPEDLSAFANGDLRFFVKAPDAGLGAFNVKVEFQCRVNDAVQTYTTSIVDHGWDGTNTWQELSIPLASFFAPNPVDPACLASVIAPFMITIENLPFFNSFAVDHVRWQSPNSHPGASSVEVQGRQLLVNGDPFVVNGVAYAPISVCEDFHGAFRDRPDRYLVDFPLIAASGANAVRIYSTFLTTAMLDAAWAEGLYVIPTFQVDLVQNQCAEGQAYMRDRLRETVLAWKDHPALLLWLIGSEINTVLTNNELCTDWYPQLDALAQEVHTAEGASFHPVGTANADSAGLVDICQAGCSDDTTLPNLDFWGVHLYRGCSFGTAFAEYQKPDCARPLIVAEFGVDAWDSLLGAENETMQADCLDSQLADAENGLFVRNPSGVSSGQVVFEWADELWKSACDPGTDWCQYDTCNSWENFAYPDPGINEEYWGMASVDVADPDARGLRPAQGRVSDAWRLGAACGVEVLSYNDLFGTVTLSFDPAAGSTDHALYYGPLSAVSTYGYTGSVSGLRANGSASVALPDESLFWVVTAQTNGTEGCYGTDSEGVERPCFPDPGSCSVPEAVHRNCECGP